MIKILIVEDEILIAESLKMDLEDAGLNVCGYTTDGDESLQMIKQESPDLILLDIYLSSEIDGVEVARSALKQNPEVKIIFITGYDFASYAESLEGIEYLDLMEKPLQVKKIVEVVKRLEQE